MATRGHRANAASTSPPQYMPILCPWGFPPVKDGQNARQWFDEYSAGNPYLEMALNCFPSESVTQPLKVGDQS